MNSRNLKVTVGRFGQAFEVKVDGESGAWMLDTARVVVKRQIGDLHSPKALSEHLKTLEELSADLENPQVEVDEIFFPEDTSSRGLIRLLLVGERVLTEDESAKLKDALKEVDLKSQADQERARGRDEAELERIKAARPELF